MLTFICLFFPAVLFVWVFEGLSRKEVSRRKWVYLYSTGVIAVNLMCWLTRRFVFQTAHVTFANVQTGITFAEASEYMILALPFALVLGALAALLSKRVHIQIEDSGDEKE